MFGFELVLKKPMEQIRWEKMLTTVTMGGKINSTLANRQRCFGSSRIYVEDLTEPNTAKHLERYFWGRGYIELIKEEISNEAFAERTKIYPNYKIQNASRAFTEKTSGCIDSGVLGGI